MDAVINYGRCKHNGRLSDKVDSMDIMDTMDAMGTIDIMGVNSEMKQQT